MMPARRQRSMSRLRSSTYPWRAASTRGDRSSSSLDCVRAAPQETTHRGADRPAIGIESARCSQRVLLAEATRQARGRRGPRPSAAAGRPRRSSSRSVAVCTNSRRSDLAHVPCLSWHAHCGACPSSRRAASVRRRSAKTPSAFAASPWSARRLPLEAPGSCAHTSSPDVRRSRRSEPHGPASPPTRSGVSGRPSSSIPVTRGQHRCPRRSWRHHSAICRRIRRSPTLTC